MSEPGAVLEVPPVATELGERFRTAGRELALVGGVVRDMLLGRVRPDAELDLATDAPPRETTRILRGWADRQYLVGVRFGTVGARKGDTLFEITTYREEVYHEEHRKPSVTFAKDLETDLSRRDFTINAMAVRLPDGTFVDPHGGVRALAAKSLDTPLEPEVAFSDDPLRMVRAARFAAQLDVTAAARVLEAIRDMRERLSIVSAERISDELSKLLVAPHAAKGLEIVVTTRPCRALPSRAAGARARAGPGPPAQGRAEAHVRGRGAVRGRPRAPPGGAPARRREAADA